MSAFILIKCYSPFIPYHRATGKQPSPNKKKVTSHSTNKIYATNTYSQFNYIKVD